MMVHDGHHSSKDLMASHCCCRDLKELVRLQPSDHSYVDRGLCVCVCVCVCEREQVQLSAGVGAEAGYKCQEVA